MGSLPPSLTLRARARPTRCTLHAPPPAAPAAPAGASTGCSSSSPPRTAPPSSPRSSAARGAAAAAAARAAPRARMRARLAQRRAPEPGPAAPRPPAPPRQPRSVLSASTEALARKVVFIRDWASRSENGSWCGAAGAALGCCCARAAPRAAHWPAGRALRHAPRAPRRAACRQKWVNAPVTTGNAIRVWTRYGPPKLMRLQYLVETRQDADAPAPATVRARPCACACGRSRARAPPSGAPPRERARARS